MRGTGSRYPGFSVRSDIFLASITLAARVLLLMLLAVRLAHGGATTETTAPAFREAGAKSVLNGGKLSDGKIRRYGFADMDKLPSKRVKPVNPPMKIRFGLRGDELVTRAVFKIRFAHSAALMPNESHLRVLLNDQVIGVVPLTKSSADRENRLEIALEPQKIEVFNTLSLEFIGHYVNDCEDPLHDGLWLDVMRGSEVQLETRPARVKNELGLLPRPFFDPGDYGRLELPFVFPERYSLSTLKAAGVTASWFGQLAAWRGARFPVHLNTPGKGHAVAFATNKERPQFLRDGKEFDGPGLSIMTNPADANSSLLLVSGRDAADLVVAARALAQASAALSGAHATIRQSARPAPRKAYDAPSWVRLDRPMKFGELVESRQQLQVFGHEPESIYVNLRIPPDLFIWRSRGIPIDLKLRYTPPVRTIDSKLAISVNGELVKSLPLSPTGLGSESSRIVLPLLDDSLFGKGSEILIPAFKLGGRNQMQFNFKFGYLPGGLCRDAQVENVQAVIDPDSQIDFTGYPNYATMPHLGYFANAGFPFTKFADLAQTAVVMPSSPSLVDVEAMLAVMGRMGEATGTASTMVEVVGPADVEAIKNRDLILVGALGAQPLLEQWQASLPVILAGPQRSIRPVPGTMDRVEQWMGTVVTRKPDPKAQKHIRGDGPLGALLGFESPLSSNRSVVALTGIRDTDMLSVLSVLEDQTMVKSMLGSVFLVHGGEVESLVAGKSYTVGELPFWTQLWFPLSHHPIVLALMAVLAVLIFAFALWRSLQAVAQRRLASEVDDSGT